jgi:predicted small metal-binding protein
MAEGKEEGHKCAYECRDVGFDCEWHCVADSEDQLIEKVQDHSNQYHSIWNANKERISEYVKKPTPDMLK